MLLFLGMGWVKLDCSLGIINFCKKWFVFWTYTDLAFAISDFQVKVPVKASAFS
jgi:hypothetical protein